MPDLLPRPRHRPRASLGHDTRRAAVAAALVLLVACSPLAVEPPGGDGPRDGRSAVAGGRQPGEAGVVASGPMPRLRSTSTAPVRPRLGRAGAPPPADPEGPPVQARRPALVVDGEPDGGPAALLGDPDIAFATVVRRATADIGGRQVRVAIVEPFGYRVVTPRVTAQPHALWERLAGGMVVLSHELGWALDAPPGRTVELAGEAIEVGAWASVFAPDADVVVSQATAAALRLDGEAATLVALEAGADAGAVAQRLAAVGAAEVLARPEVHVASLQGDDADTVAQFEPFAYTDASGGMIAIDPAWVERNIVTTSVPVLGEVTCHRLLVQPLRAALQELVQRDLAHLLDPRDYAGCFNPRHIDRNPDANLSMHAWGLALDVNASTNALGAAPQLDRRVVAAFQRWGFTWGGTWHRPDGMHFELGSLPG